MTRLKDERGFVLTTAIVVLMIILMLGLALIATINVQTHQTGNERSGEASFNLAESVLEAEAYQLQVAWPSTAGTALPACNQSSPQAVGCEGVALSNTLTSTYAGVGYSGATWSAQVLDNTSPTGSSTCSGGSSSTTTSSTSTSSSSASSYSDTLAGSAPSWDCNGDGHLWVRAQAIVGGQKRILVEQMVRQDTTVTVPDNTVTAGGVYTENLGNKVMIEARDSSSGLTGPVEVRCGTPTTQPTQGQGNCLGWSPAKGQLDPAGAYGAGYVDPNGGGQTLTNDQIQALVLTAQENGTYYSSSSSPPKNTCPPGGTAGIVVVQGLSCSYTSNATWNTAAAPGALVFLNGTLSMSGTGQFYGVIYMANQQGGLPPCTSAQLNAAPILTIDGNATVSGAVFVDRCGVVAVGESGNGQNPGNIKFSSNGLAGLYAAQAARPAQNTFQIVHN